jgi:hypothetical protein
MTMMVCFALGTMRLRLVDPGHKLTFVAVEMQEEDDDQEQKLINEGKWQHVADVLQRTN